LSSILLHLLLFDEVIYSFDFYLLVEADFSFDLYVSARLF